MAVIACLIFPLVPVVHAPSAIKVTHPPTVEENPLGAVIVLIVAVPVTCCTCPVSAIVEADGIVRPIRELGKPATLPIFAHVSSFEETDTPAGSGFPKS